MVRMASTASAKMRSPRVQCSVPQITVARLGWINDEFEQQDAGAETLGKELAPVSDFPGALATREPANLFLDPNALVREEHI